MAKGLSLATLAAVVIVGFGAHAAAAPVAEQSIAKVRVVQVAGRVQQGGIARVVLAVSPRGVRCLLTVRAPTGRVAIRSSRTAAAGRASFVWTVGAAAIPGRWRVAVACGRAGRASTSFLVVRRAQPPPPPPPSATVVVEKSGFSFEDTTTTRSVGYGVVLANTSTDQDAGNLTVNVNVLDASARVLTGESNTILVIPAASRYYLGSEVFVTLAEVPASLEIRVTIGESRPRGAVLPPVANVRVIDDSGTRVEGELTNPFTQELSSFARITAVVFDAAGNVAGGGFSFPDAAVPPGGRAGFSVRVFGVPISRAASAEVSVEPEID